MDGFREFLRVRQIEGEPHRRWFDAPQAELIVWLNERSQPFGFQFCYQQDGKPYALSWRAGGVFSHARINDGDYALRRHKMTPVLEAAHGPDIARLRERFAQAGATLPEDVHALVGAALSSYPDAPEIDVQPPTRRLKRADE